MYLGTLLQEKIAKDNCKNFVDNCAIDFVELHNLCMLYKLLGKIGWSNKEKSYPLCKCDKGEGICCKLGLEWDRNDSDDDSDSARAPREHVCKLISNEEQQECWEKALAYYDTLEGENEEAKKEKME